MKNKKRGCCWMAIKVDLEKGYDRLKCDFVVDTLIDIGFPYYFVNLVYWCITSPNMQVLWNRETLGKFQPSRGIRQGSYIPISFRVVHWKIVSFDKYGCETGWTEANPIKQNGPKLAYLALAYDILFLAEASFTQTLILKKILDVFCNSSGQRVSGEKTKIFFSNNVQWQDREDIANILGYRRALDLGKYLGVPLHHGRVSKQNYQFVIDKIKQRLST